MMLDDSFSGKYRIRSFLYYLSFLTLVPCAGASAAATDIADEPIITQTEFKPKPNLMVIMDDSGSMAWDYMPDAADGSSAVGFYSSQCNGIAYNPEVDYDPPVFSDGSSYPQSNFAWARNNGYSTSNNNNNWTNIGVQRTQKLPLKNAVALHATTGTQTFNFSSRSAIKIGHKTFRPNQIVRFEVSETSRYMQGVIVSASYDVKNDSAQVVVNITSASNGWRATATDSWDAYWNGGYYYEYHGKENALNWAYNNSGTVNSNSKFYKECKTSFSSSRDLQNSDRNLFEFVPVTSESSQQIKDNYANWFSYYRTRQNMMRSSMGHALQPLDDDYRVGFMTINKRGASGNDSQNFRPINDFNASQKQKFYSSLYSHTASGNTPLRAALAEAGRYYAKNLSSQQTDPIQYACQRNYALLTTDGFWNDAAGTGLGGGSIGNADGGAGAPYQDSFANTLADVAFYYYKNDLRTTALRNCTGARVGNNPAKDVCENIVTPSGKDDAKHQHMTTFTIGLGVSGTIPFSNEEGVAKNISWPSPSANNARTIDDLWHASVNGRGQHYSAQNSHELTKAIQGIVTSMQEVQGAASASATSTLDLVQGEDNIAFEASYITGVWQGDLVAQRLDAVTAEIEVGSPKWSAHEKLNARSSSSRKIYYKSGQEMEEFKWDSMTGEIKSYFVNMCGINSRLTQCSSLNEQQKNTINVGEELVNYIRGDQSKEGDNSVEPFFRIRKSKLGDIINSKPLHVGRPPFNYSDNGHAAYKLEKEDRRKVVYVGANDGMLHAFDANTGEEIWAYIPSAVMPNLYRLADFKYGTNDTQPHFYFVDGKTVQGDIYVDGSWRTILVGGLNKGGRSYYALDITDPNQPKPIWEFNHFDSTENNNLGLSYSTPVITKKIDGTWVVMFSSGYNNINPGDGKGRLFVLEAKTGKLLQSIATSAGDVNTPSGMGQINVWVNSQADNTTKRVYAGDLLGNVWRFMLEQNLTNVTKLAEMQDANGNVQPITTEPKLREYSRQAIVVVGTGKYLGRGDVGNLQMQSIAAMRDDLTDTGWGVLRKNPQKFKEVKIKKNALQAKAEAVAVDWSTGGGWWADFATPGERMALNMEWDGTRLMVASTIPDGDQCKSGGSSWFYNIELEGGKTIGDQYSLDALIVGFTLIYNKDGKPKLLIRDSRGSPSITKDGQIVGSSTIILPPRRVNWREIH